MANAQLDERERGIDAKRGKGIPVAESLASVGRIAVSHRRALLWVAGALALLVMAVMAHSMAQFPADTAISDTLQRLRGTAIASFVNFPSDVNQPVPGAIIAFAIIGALALLRRLIEALATAVVTFGTDLVNVVINALVARPRPHNVHVQTLGGLGGHSFPSGHVVHVTALFGFLFFLTLLVRQAHPERSVWLLPAQVICVYFIALIGVGRVIEGAHQPSDVLAGYLVAALTLPLAILFHRWLTRKWQRHQERRALADSMKLTR